ncbi:MAG: diaminopimelate epimerase [Planctomycetota bacterium]|nr:MAG: diaminopimelate epimerase [Planctomycetota bacterium]
MKFTKMHGIGNDYVCVNCFEEQIDDPAELARKVSDRHFGVGSDGLILIRPGDVADCRMQMFNSDGSEAEMCGNGIRCVAKYAYEHGIARKEEMTVETGAGVLTLRLFVNDGVVEEVSVNMGEPRLSPAEIPVTLSGEKVVSAPLNVLDRKFKITCVSMGNPHCVIFVDDVGNFPVGKYGPLIEAHDIFPRKTNVEFVELVNSGEVIQRTWERGSGETLACGTGASAACVAGVLNDLTRCAVLVHLSGGDLKLEWKKDNRVYMTGPAVEVFAGEWKG